MGKSKEVQLNTQKTKLRSIVGDLDRLETMLNNLSSNLNETEKDMLEYLHNRVSNSENNYIENYVELETNEFDLSDFPNIDAFQSKLYLAVVKCNGILKRNSTSSTSSEPQPASLNSNYLQSLPKLQLPTFSGDIANYKSFIENFHAVIDSSGLESSQKFQYLKNSLTDEAALSIAGLSATDENYHIALTLLDSRYNKPKLVVQAHLKNIFNLESVTKASSNSLQHFVDTLNKNILCLRNLNINDKDLASAFLSYIVEQKLDLETREKFKAFKPSEIPNIDETIQFLQDRAQFLVDVGFEKSCQKSPKNLSLFTSNNLSSTCKLCKGPHPLFKCSTFQNLSIEQRIAKIKELQVCRNCFGNHHVQRCKSKYKCFQCKGLHHTLVHQIYKKPSNNSAEQHSTVVPSSPSNVTLTCNSSFSNQILLSTAEVYVKDNQGTLNTIRCLLDSGSMHNLITTTVMNKLQLPSETINMSLLGINSKATAIHRLTNIQIYSKNNSFSTRLPCLVIDHITVPIPNITFSKKILSIPSNIQLADKHFNKTGEIDILIGTALFYDLLEPQKISLGYGMPTLQETKLGYVIAGQMKFQGCKPISISNCSISTSNSEFDLQRFWEIENIEPKNPLSYMSSNEQYCEEQFIENTSRTSDGRYIVSIPFNERLRDLGSSYNIALTRFLALERRLQRNPDIYKQYSEFIEEYGKLGHLSELSSETVNPETLNFLPHHEVLRFSSTTTKLRVVFDGSAKTTSGISINDCQVMGPVVQRDLFSILLNFRQYQIALTGDIEKMYRQVHIATNHRKYQCILWRSNINKEIRILQLNTVTYGLKSSSYLTTKCLQTLGKENQLEYPEAGLKIINDFYMDDFVSGANSVTEAKQLIVDVSKILSKAGFPLRKLRCSHKDVIDFYPPSNSIMQFSTTESKTLGILWDSSSDVFSYKFTIPNNTYVKSKRNLLSIVAQIFDPLGLLSPIIIRAKLLIQLLWKLGLSWDEELPSSYIQEWNGFSSDLSQTPSLNISRSVFHLEARQLELHGFCDASFRAYGACIYIRSVFDNHSKTHLLCSKSRVAPLKPITIPRLELSGAVLLTELVLKVITVFSYKFHGLYFWSDSKIVLGWINSAPNKFKPFVANRIAYIRENTDPLNWHYCSSQDNPADLISRGSSIQSISDSYWFRGPCFLQMPHFILPETLNTTNLELPEIKVQSVNVLCTDDSNFLDELISKHSSFTKLQRIFAFVLRFIRNLRHSHVEKENGPLKVSELSKSLLGLVLFCQRSSFASEINSLSNSNHISLKNDHLSSLNLFLDKEGLIRVGGRIQNANLHYDNLHPLLLPNKHPLTSLIVDHYHKKYLHCGANQLLAVLRDRFWPIAGRVICRQIVRKCVTCFRSNPRFSSNIMGNLPGSRISVYESCFTETGVDFAGPLLIKDRYTRNPKLIKAYLVLFICMTTRAVHLELVTSLSHQAFIETFKRFIARRGKPRCMHSDNATNFIAAADELKQLYLYLRQNSVQSKLFEYLSVEGINWNFIPPSSPHFGGLWEANIKSAKRHLYKILKTTNLNYEALYTLLTQIESVLNSRPLAPLSNDPNDFQSLTPFHFLIGRRYDAPSEPLLESLPSNRLDSFQHRQQLLQHFWKRWHREVLPEMQRRMKWKLAPENQLQVGALVLLSDSNTPPFQWPLARVIKLHPGADGKIRVVTLRNSSGGTLKRPIVKICVLPLDSNDVSEN